MSGQVTILQLPTASALTGVESVPVVQNGVTVQTTTAAIAGAGALNYPFLTVGSAAGLNQGRYLSGTAGISLTDNGAGNSLAINLTGTAASLNAASQGIIVKNSASTVTNVQLTVGAGMTIANANGTTGNPLIGLNTNLQNVASLSGIGLVIVNGSTFTQTTLGGTSNQIVVTNGNAGAGAPTFSLANNPILPGNASVTIPIGSTAQRSGGNGALRYNSDTGLFEGYTAGAWTPFTTGGGAGVTSIATGTGLTGGPITTTGTISIDSTVVTLTGTQTLTNKTISGASNTLSNIGNGSLTNSSITINGNAVSLGGSTTVTAAAPFALTIGTGLSGTSYNGSVAVTVAIANTAVTAAAYGSASSVATFTVNAQGQLTAAATTAIAITNSQVSGLGTMSTQNANAVAITGGTINGTSVGATTRSTGDFTTISGNTVTSTTPVLSFNAANTIGSFGTTTASSYNQFIIQNQSNTAGASSNYVVSNNLGTDSTYYGEFGMNSSTFSASTPIDFYSLNNGIYYSGHDGDVSFGSGNGFKTYLTYGTVGQSSHVINATGAIGFTTNLGTTPALSGTTGYGTAGQPMLSGGSGAPPTYGTLGISGGGTNSTATATAGGAAYGTGTAYAVTAAGTAGQVLTSTGATAPTWSGISGGTF